MTLKAECHTQGLAVRDDLHFVNLAMALDATDTTIHVSRVIKIRIIGRLVDPDPWHRLAARVAVSNRSEQGAVGLDLVVAVHARLRSRNIGVARLVDVTVAKAAIYPELGYVLLVAEGHRLHRSIPDPGILRRHVISDTRRRNSC